MSAKFAPRMPARWIRIALLPVGLPVVIIVMAFVTAFTFVAASLRKDPSRGE